MNEHIKKGMFPWIENLRLFYSGNVIVFFNVQT